MERIRCLHIMWFKCTYACFTGQGSHFHENYYRIIPLPLTIPIFSKPFNLKCWPMYVRWSIMLYNFSFYYFIRHGTQHENWVKVTFCYNMGLGDTAFLISQWVSGYQWEQCCVVRCLQLYISFQLQLNCFILLPIMATKPCIYTAITVEVDMRTVCQRW